MLSRSTPRHRERHQAVFLYAVTVLPSPYTQHIVVYRCSYSHAFYRQPPSALSPSHHLTLQAWQIFSTWFILGSFPRAHCFPTGLRKYLASNYPNTHVPQPKPIQRCPSICESTSLLTTTIVVSKPSHAIDACKPIHAHASIACHACVRCPSRACISSPVSTARSRASTHAFPFSRTQPVD
jgi:hypothetical protein